MTDEFYEYMINRENAKKDLKYLEKKIQEQGEKIIMASLLLNKPDCKEEHIKKIISYLKEFNEDYITYKKRINMAKNQLNE